MIAHHIAEQELIKLPKKSLRALLKKLKIKGYGDCSKDGIVREILRRVELRKKLKEMCR